MDRSLVERARRGDAEAFGALVLTHSDRLFHAARLILRDMDLAEDAVQECLVSAWRELPRLRDPDRFEAWLHRMLVNACYDEAKGQRPRLDLKAIDASAGPDSQMDIALREQLDTAFRRLPMNQRTVLVLHHYLGLTLPEIAAAVAAPLGTVKSRLFYATSAMRAAIEADERRAIASRGESA